MTKEFMELMLRAPVVPDWFAPDMEAPPAPPTPPPCWESMSKDERVEAYKPIEVWEVECAKWQAKCQQQKIFQWPSYYARKVMEAAGDEVVDKDVRIHIAPGKGQVIGGDPAPDIDTHSTPAGPKSGSVVWDEPVT